MRIILLLILGYVIFRMVTKYLTARSSSTASPTTTLPHSLVKCVTCATWIPQEQVINESGATYCSPECRDNAPPR